MIARIVVALPVDFAVLEDGHYQLHQTELDGYLIRMYPPVRTDVPIDSNEPVDMTINDLPAFLCNGLQIDFQKESYDRSMSAENDPSDALINKVLNSLILRLRFVAGSHRLRHLEFVECKYRLQYLKLC